MILPNIDGETDQLTTLYSRLLINFRNEEVKKAL